MMARNRSTASTARGLLPSSAAFVIAGASCCDMNRAQIATNGPQVSTNEVKQGRLLGNMQSVLEAA